MLSKLGVRFTILLLISLFTAQFAKGQCYSDTGKHTCFQYDDWDARMEFLDGAPQIGWVVEDFAPGWANPKTGGSGHLWVQVTLIADDPNFVYEADCVNKNAQGECVGTYKYTPRFQNPYSATQRWTGNGENNFGGMQHPFPSCSAGEETTWSGTIKVESIAQPWPWDPNTTVSVKSFYSQNPNKLSASGSSPNSACQALTNTWGPLDGYMQVSWDANIQRFVAPYAIFYHNDNDWPKGWQTKVEITNNTGSSVTYTIENHLWGRNHGHSGGDECKCFNENAIETSTTIGNGQSETIDAFRFHVPDSVRTAHDTGLFIRLNPVLSGTTVKVHVFPNSSGSVICASPACEQ